MPDERLYVVQEGIGGEYLLAGKLPVGKIGARSDRSEALEFLPPALALQQHPFGGAIGIAQADAHQKTVELGFRQGKGTDLVGRVLGGDDEKRLGQRAGLAFSGDLPFLHGFEKGALGFWRGAVDLVGEDQLGEDRPLVKMKPFRTPLVHRYTDYIGRQQIAGELDALVVQPHQGRQQMRQGGLAHAGKILDEQMPLTEQAGHGQAQGPGFSQDDAVRLAEQSLQCGVVSEWQQSGHPLARDKMGMFLKYWNKGRSPSYWWPDADRFNPHPDPLPVSGEGKSGERAGSILKYPLSPPPGRGPG